LKKSIVLALSLLSTSNAFHVKPVDKSLEEGCVDCHFVYQAEFLPERSWIKMFEEGELKDHFGKEVLLSKDLKENLLQYYVENSSDRENSKAQKKINGSIQPDSTPLRVSKVPYIWSKHDDLKEEMFLKNEKVKSYANCVACHRDAEKGEFEEDEVKVPHWSKSFFFGWQKED
jgi:hypothetical protein